MVLICPNDSWPFMHAAEDKDPLMSLSLVDRLLAVWILLAMVGVDFESHLEGKRESETEWFLSLPFGDLSMLLNGRVCIRYSAFC